VALVRTRRLTMLLLRQRPAFRCDPITTSLTMTCISVCCTLYPAHLVGVHGLGDGDLLLRHGVPPGSRDLDDGVPCHARQDRPLRRHTVPS